MILLQPVNCVGFILTVVVVVVGVFLHQPICCVGIILIVVVVGGVLFLVNQSAMLVLSSLLLVLLVCYCFNLSVVMVSS